MPKFSLAGEYVTPSFQLTFAFKQCITTVDSFPLIVSSNLLRLPFQDSIGDSLCLPLFLWLIQGLEWSFWLFICSIMGCLDVVVFNRKLY